MPSLPSNSFSISEKASILSTNKQTRKHNREESQNNLPACTMLLHHGLALCRFCNCLHFDMYNWFHTHLAPRCETGKGNGGVQLMNSFSEAHLSAPSEAVAEARHTKCCQYERLTNHKNVASKLKRSTYGERGGWASLCSSHAAAWSQFSPQTDQNSAPLHEPGDALELETLGTKLAPQTPQSVH